MSFAIALLGGHPMRPRKVRFTPRRNSFGGRLVPSRWWRIPHSEDPVSTPVSGGSMLGTIDGLCRDLVERVVPTRAEIEGENSLDIMSMATNIGEWVE